MNEGSLIIYRLLLDNISVILLAWEGQITMIKRLTDNGQHTGDGYLLLHYIIAHNWLQRHIAVNDPRIIYDHFVTNRHA